MLFLFFFPATVSIFLKLRSVPVFEEEEVVCGSVFCDVSIELGSSERCPLDLRTISKAYPKKIRRIVE